MQAISLLSFLASLLVIPPDLPEIDGWAGPD